MIICVNTRHKADRRGNPVQRPLHENDGKDKRCSVVVPEDDDEREERRFGFRFHLFSSSAAQPMIYAYHLSISRYTFAISVKPRDSTNATRMASALEWSTFWSSPSRQAISCLRTSSGFMELSQSSPSALLVYSVYTCQTSEPLKVNTVPRKFLAFS